MPSRLQSFLSAARRWIGRTTQRRLVVWSIGFWVVSMVALSTAFSLVGQSQLLTETRLRNTQFASTISRDVSSQISNITGGARTFAQYMASLGPDLDAQAGALLGLRLSSSRYRALYYFGAGDVLLLNLSDTTAGLLAIKTPAELIGRPAAAAGAETTETYQSAVSGGTTVSGVYYTPLDYVPVLDIGMPVIFPTGERTVVVFEVDLTDIWNKIASATIGETGVTYAASRDGKVIAHQNPGFIGREIPLEIQPLLGNYEGSVQLVDPLTGRRVIAAYSPVGGQTGWGIVVQQDRAEINASIRKTTTAVMIVLLALGAAGTAGILFLVGGFTRPIKELTALTRDIARTGQLSRTRLAQRQDELGQLSQAFDQMIDKVTDTEGRLSVSEERYRSLFEHANDAILLLDRSGIADCNRKAEEMFGVSRDQLVGRLPSVISADKQEDGLDSAEKEQILMDLAFKGEEQLFEWRHRRLNGELFDAEVCLNRLNIGNRPILMGIIRDITERKKAAEELRQAQKEKEEAAAAERTRLARDLHDAVSQTLFSASIIADVLPRIWEKNQEEAGRRLEEIRQLTRGALAEMRTLLFELRPAALADAEMGYLLHQLAESVTGRSRIPVDVVVEGECDLDADVKVALYRITQEALNNVVKHAAANGARVMVSCIPGNVTLTIRDDGKGFDVAGVHPDSLGLGIMRDRAEAIGADLSIVSAIGAGSEVVVKVRTAGQEVEA